ncbi:MAG: response regulator [Candidatus Methylumidiphilus sp.]
MNTPPIEAPILILEDCDEDFDTAWEGFRRAGYAGRLLRAHSGDDCLDLLLAQSGAAGQCPLLVLLDLNTPGRDGRDALREIKADPRLRQLPVIVLTTSANPRDLQLCYESGANAYHVKPVRFPDHLALLQQIFAYWLGSTVLPPGPEQTR